MHAALRQAHEAARTVVAASDGCASATCSLNFRPGQAHDGQRTIAAKMHAGGRHLLAEPPCDADDVWVLPRAHARAVALRVLSGGCAASVERAPPPIGVATSGTALGLRGGGKSDDEDAMGEGGEGVCDEMPCTQASGDFEFEDDLQLRVGARCRVLGFLPSRVA